MERDVVLSPCCPEAVKALMRAVDSSVQRQWRSGAPYSYLNAAFMDQHRLFSIAAYS
jgi:hypothetical protein